ncbi:MAG: glyoxalase [Solirubrobacterales bacterium]|nr:glyoxalase [Solirubrobacterales bacterium]
MASIDSITLGVDDPADASRFYSSAFGLPELIKVDTDTAPSRGFRGFTVSLLAAQPANVKALFDDAIAAGATQVKPLTKTFWGFGGVVQAPDGSLWKLASSSKKDTGPAEKRVDKAVVLIAVENVKASKQFYAQHGLKVGRSFGSYVDFDLGDSPVGFGLYTRKALAKDAGVPAEGEGSHRLTLNGDIGSFSDPDGFNWN